MSDNEQIKVLQLIEGLSFGGAETKLLELIARMDRERFDTIVCSLGMGDQIRDRFDDLGVKFVNFARSRRIDPKLIWQVNRLIHEEKVDVVMTTLFYADVVGALARAFTPAKAVFSWETISAPEWLRKHRLLTYRFAMRFCDKVISVSQATARWLIEERGLPREKVEVIPYGVNLELFKQGKNTQLKKQLGVSKDAPLVGVVARLHPQKGHGYLIEAAKTIVHDHSDVRFVLVGDGVLRDELKEQVKSAELEEHFLFLGFRDDVKDLLRIFDLFVLPSLYEGLPNVVLEAMASSLPVVATAVDGTPELVVDNETGYLVPPRNPHALAQKISLLLNDEKRAAIFGKQGRKRVEEQFSLDLQVQNFQNLYTRYVYNGQV
ncbi:glycosyltransferase [candidate division KSB1 bacterium]|nr:glycosyltransferase [candidate division KSB1 bacterium]NIR68380.1 glycosyltransferase [candidate division KSB1 bacterium]NIS25324.1 glycosyltransferase [candidate division KSB1 bacterium]NIT72235.1 glycosyltransferase [candidate division KSB1 bacterium]NIU26043.1 glycosyltransferase [candidate division KSB1 bacterium]